MKIESPPTSDLGLNPERIILDFVRDFNDYFLDEDYDKRYFPRLSWFQRYLTQHDTVLNLGCSRGRETFALMWMLGARSVVGIDQVSIRIMEANRILGALRTLPKNMEFVLSHCPPSYSVELSQWYEREIPAQIKQGLLPAFSQGEMAELTPYPSSFFDLVYSRYVLHLIYDHSPKGIAPVINTMARLIKPSVGRVVVVEPTEKKGKSYDFEPAFAEAGLELVAKVMERDELGGADCAESEPTGYVYLKSG
ncbi:MAG: class I SAM-dependent methyltransferase [Chloroflexota bacterium]